MPTTAATIEVRKFSLYAVSVQYATAGVGYRRKDSIVDDQAVLTMFKRAVIDQDQAAWHEVWNRYHPVIVQRLRRELRSWAITKDEIRDLAQSVFIKFWEDSRSWDRVDHLYSHSGQEGILSRLHSTAVFTVQRFRQKQVRRWIPVIRINYPLCSDINQSYLRNLASNGLSLKYRDVFLLHLRGCENAAIAELLRLDPKKISVHINRAWERYVYVLLTHRQESPSFDVLFKYLITHRQEVNL